MEVRFSDGTNTYDLYTGYVSVLDYTPTVGDRSKTSVSDNLMIFINAPTLADLQTTKDTINYWLALANEQWNTVNETRIYIEIKQTDETGWRRSELLGGRLQPVQGTLNSHSQKKQEYQVIFERRNWWEWDEEEIPLSIDNSAWATGGVYVSNGQAVVSVDPNSPAIFIRGTDITGDPQTPVPVRIELTSQDVRYTDRIFISHNVFSTLNALSNDHLILATTATDPLPLDDSTDTDSTNYVRMWQSGAGTETLELPLSSSLLTKCAGRWFRLLARIKTEVGTEAIWGKFELFSGSRTDQNAMTSTEYTLISEDTTDGYDLIDFGVIRLPTIKTDLPSYGHDLVMTVRSGAAHEIRLDFIQLSPIDSFHHIETSFTSAAIPEKIVADGHIKRTYLVPEAGYAMDGFSDISEHISLWAGRDQWVTILHRNSEYLMEYTQLLSVQMYYRPRRVTV